MKYLLLCLFLVCSLKAICQNNRERKIIVVATDTTNLFNRIAQVLYENEYSIENKDLQGGFISTKEKALRNLSFSLEVKLRALLKDSIITFTGESRLNHSIMGQPPSFDPIVNFGTKNSPNKVSWNEMLSIAKRFGINVTFSK